MKAICLGTETYSNGAGTREFMRLRTASGRIEECTRYQYIDGTTRFETSADYGRELDPEEHDKNRAEIIAAFLKLI